MIFVGRSTQLCRVVLAVAGLSGCAAGESPKDAKAGRSATGGTSAVEASGGTPGSAGQLGIAGQDDIAGRGGGMSGFGGTPDLGGGSGAAGAPVVPEGPKGKIPNSAYPETMINLPREDWQKGLVSPTLEFAHHNQPVVIDGYLLLAGNARFSIYDISDPSKPVRISEAVSPDACAKCGEKHEGEAEGHQVSFAKYGSRTYAATISGKGIDLWDLSAPNKPEHVKSVHLEGIDFGDFTNAVWGVYWQGSTIYVGGTNTGLHIIDASRPEQATVLKRIPISAFGNVSAGPIYAVGNILVITTPKESGGIATLDISDPHKPFVLDSISATKSYIGAFYRHHVFLQNPLRVWDVLSDPTAIGGATSPLATLTTPNSEYLSFSDGQAFLGLARPDPGALKIDVKDPKSMKVKNRIWGRMDLSGNDDQFTIAVGNLLVMSDDQLQSNGKGYVGTVIGVHAAKPDTVPPAVDTIIPKAGAKNVSVKSRIGISFTDNLEFATVNAQNFVVRPVAGAPISGTFGIYMGVLNFDPETDLQPKTTYEVVLAQGGIRDYVGNALTSEFKATFTTR